MSVYEKKKRRIYSCLDQAMACMVTGAVVCGVTIAAAPKAHANAVISLGNDRSFSIGFGARASYQSHNISNARDSNSVSLDNFRLYMGAQLNKHIKATVNVERLSGNNWNLLDGIFQFEPSSAINIWVGRMLTPSDRSNLDGPYYLNSYLYPGVVAQYPGVWSGRDDGINIWGRLAHNHFRYVAGIFRGHNRYDNASNGGNHPLFAARAEYNFLDPEDSPAYYTASTYYGQHDILAIALVGQYQVDGVGTAQNRGDYKAWNVDGLFEKRIGKDGKSGTYTLEGAYYQYHTDGVQDVASGWHGAANDANVGGIQAGTAFMLDTAYLIPYTLGWGRFQPVIRYQQFKPYHYAATNNGKTTQFEAGSNYVIDGHNSVITLDYVHYNSPSTKASDGFLAGVQFQY